MNKSEKLHLWIYVACFAIICFLMSVYDALEGFDYLISDFLFQRPSDTCADVKIIALDEKTLDKLGKYNDTDYRYYFAEVVEAVSKHNPAVVVLDIQFTGYSSSTESDMKLAKACEEAGNVIIGAQINYRETGVLENDKIVKIIYEPVLEKPYSEICDSCILGLVNTKVGGAKNDNKSSDNYIRMTIPTINLEGRNYDSLGYAAYKLYMERMGIPIRNEFTPWERFLFTYSSLPNEASAYTRISLCDIVDGTQKMQDFEDSVVFVGAYATGLQDQFYTPIKRSEAMFGVEIHANIFDAVRKRMLQKRMAPLLYSFLFAFFTASVAYVEYKKKIAANSLITIFGIFVCFAGEYIFYKSRIYVPCMYLAVMLLVMYVTAIVKQYLFENLAKRKTLSAFKKYVAPQVVENVMKGDSFEINLGGVKRNIACLFVDIRGFTSMSEAMEPEQVVEVLNKYLSLVTNAIFKNEGTLDKFIGDAAMAVFNAPFDLEDYAYKAVKCGLDISDDFASIENELIEEYGRKVSCGIGVNIGDAVIGNIGCDFRMDYTAIGDTVNTAARLEANAKAGEILISEELNNVIKDRFYTECLGGLKLKGKANEIITYRVLGAKEENEKG